VWVTITLLAVSITLALDLTGDHLFPLLFTNVPFSPYFRLAIWGLLLSTFGLVPFTSDAGACRVVCVSYSFWRAPTNRTGPLLCGIPEDGGTGQSPGRFLGGTLDVSTARLAYVSQCKARIPIEHHKNGSRL
jgi:hypothetical protein